MKSKAEIAAEEYVEKCQWSEFIYEDKSGMPWEEQLKRPSDIPSNIKLGFLAGFDACEKMIKERLPPRRTVPTKSMVYSDKALIELLYEYINDTNDIYAGSICGYCWDKMSDDGYPTENDKLKAQAKDLQAEIARLKSKYESKYLGRA